ncbi:MAG: type II secretion system F family protein, partial [Clostridia bacterium]|nr:type II secretion system F family protein [Clostridia bacterium]
VPIICGILVFFAFVLFLEYARRNRSAIAKRMRYYSGAAPRPEDAIEPQSDEKLAQKAMAFVRAIAKKFENLKQAQSLDFKMQQAGLPLLGSEFVVVAILGAIFAGTVTMLLTMNMGMAVTVGFIALIGEWAYVQFRISHRRDRFTNQLGDCLTMVANAMRAGFSFLQAMELVSREMEPPISEEFGRVMREMNVGARMEKALEDMDARVASPDFSLMVTAVLIQRQVGGSLAQILDTISDTINERIRMRREVKALTAQGRLSGVILALLPVGLAFLLASANPTYLDPLFEEPLGRIAIAVAAVLEIIGYFVIQRVVDIDV